MHPNFLRGNLDLILLTILEHTPMYGLQIIQEAQSRTDGYFDFKEGSLYPALYRLEQAGHLQTEAREPGRNGLPRKYYRLTERGLALLKTRRQEWATFTNAMQAVKGPA